VTLKSGLEVN